MKELEKLSEEEKELLYNAPIIVSIFAAVTNDGQIDEDEKADAIKLAHLRTYTSPHILHDYYKKVDERFEERFDEYRDALPKDEKEREEYLKQELLKLNEVLPKLHRDFAIHLTQSLKSFSKHVFRSNSHFLEYFLLPVIMNELEKDIFEE